MNSFTFLLVGRCRKRQKKSMIGPRRKKLRHCQKFIAKNRDLLFLRQDVIGRGLMDDVISTLLAIFGAYLYSKSRLRFG